MIPARWMGLAEHDLELIERVGGVFETAASAT